LARTRKKAVIYSTASVYAIRALVHLARHAVGEFVSLRHIARQEDLPLYFLSTIFQRLARQGILQSRKGTGGGFTFRLDPGELRLLDVVDTFDREPCYRECAMGYAECSEEHPCPMHEGWKAVRSSIEDCLETRTIGELARLPQNRYFRLRSLRCNAAQSGSFPPHHASGRIVSGRPKRMDGRNSVRSLRDAPSAE